MTPSMLALFAALAGLLVGVAVARFFLRERISAAEALGRAAAAAELGQLRERAQGLEAERVRREQSVESERARRQQVDEELRAERDRLTREGEAARAEVARLEERTAQLTPLVGAVEEARRALDGARAEVGALSARVEGLTAQLEAAEVALDEARAAQVEERTARLAAEGQLGTLVAARAELETRLDAEREKSAEQLGLLTEAKEALTAQFQVLAQQILEEKSQRFAEQNKASLDTLLEPFRLQLTEFKGKVEEVYVTEGKDRSALKAQVEQLVGLNQRLSAEASDLTRALKGSNKAQGNWGELVLERVLESAGLRRGHDYDVQESHVREDGSRAQPDVVVHLPGDRHFVVDAKVSLIAWQEVVTGPAETRSAALAAHVESIRRHVKGLAERNYQQLYGVRALDFVTLFVPIEPASLAAIEAAPELWKEAWERNVLLVGPSSLLFVLRTVAHLWRQEQQTANAQEIARRGGELYDRLAGFVEELRRVGMKLAEASGAFEDAKRKLSVGRGNVLRQAELLRELGVKPTKALPKDWVQAGAEDGSPEALEAGSKEAPAVERDGV